MFNLNIISATKSVFEVSRLKCSRNVNIFIILKLKEKIMMPKICPLRNVIGRIFIFVITFLALNILPMIKY